MLCARGHNALLAPAGGGGGGGGGVLSASGPGGGGGGLSASGPGGGGGGGACCRLLAQGGGYLSGKEGKGGALYYMNGFTTAPGICPCVCEFSLTRLLIISRLFRRPRPGTYVPPCPPLATPLPGHIARHMEIKDVIYRCYPAFESF